MIQWMPSYQPPPQGYKVLCCNKGDYWVAQRFKHHWFPIPFVDSSLAELEPPEFWCHIPFNQHDKGYMMVLVKGYDKPMTMDQFEKKEPHDFNLFVDAMYEKWKNSR